MSLFVGSTKSFAQIALPRPPAYLTSVPQRAGWLVEHYWDLADLPALAGEYAAANGNVTEFEQAFVNYLSLFPLAQNDSLCHASVAALMNRADCSGSTLESVLSLAEKYLFQLMSPMADEACFSHFVDAAIECRNLSEMRRGDCEYWARVVANNKVGETVEDFGFERADGRSVLFSSIGGERILILFDTMCQDCKSLLARLKESAPAGVQIVAVAVNATRDRLRSFAADLPKEWIVGYDNSETINGGAFAIRQLPDVYRISADGIVLEKHCKL